MNQNLRIVGKFTEVMNELRFARLRELTEKIMEDGPVKRLEYEFKDLDAGDREYVLCGIRDALKDQNADIATAEMDKAMVERELLDIQKRIAELDDGVSCLKDIQSDLEWWNRSCLEEDEIENPWLFERFDKDAYYAAKYGD